LTLYFIYVKFKKDEIAGANWPHSSKQFITRRIGVNGFYVFLGAVCVVAVVVGIARWWQRHKDAAKQQATGFSPQKHPNDELMRHARESLSLLGDDEAVVCEVDGEGKPKTVMFRSRSGRAVTAPVRNVVGTCVYLARTRFARPFVRQLYPHARFARL